MSDDESAENGCLAKARSRRSRSDKTGRAAALERLKSLKGSKNKYEVSTLKNVYDVVDEDTYVETVNERLKDDWIIDDGTGYCENGLELFDDDLAEEEDSWHRERKKGKDSKPKKKQTREEKESAKAGFQSVRDMLSSMPQKRKRQENGEGASGADGKDEDLLGDLMQELHEEKKAKIAPSSSKFLEVTQAKEKFLESARIKEVPFSSSSKVIAKRKFQAFKVSEPLLSDVKLEPEDTPVMSNSFEDDSFPPNFPDDDEMFIKSINASENEVVVVKTENDSEHTAIKSSTKASVDSVDASASSVQSSIKRETTSKISYNLNSIDKFNSYVQSESSPVVLSDSPDQALTMMITKNEEDSQVLNFYWLDICEEPRNPGHLYVFGKVKVSSENYASCCVVLKDVERIMYLLPREKGENEEEITIGDVYSEFNEEIVPRYLKMTQFKSRIVQKKYCFGLQDVPTFSDYLEVRYSGTVPALPDDLQGKTFSRVFGASAPLMENFLLEKQLKGPSWLQLCNPRQVESGQQHSWCKFEFVGDVRNLSVNPEKEKLNCPPLVLVSISVQTVPDSASRKDTIVAVGVAVNRRFEINSSQTQDGLFHDHFILLNKAPGCVWPFDLDKCMNKTTVKFDSERSMLGMLLAKLQQIDADAYIGHDMNFELLLFHLISHKVANWSRVGRLRRSTHLLKSGKMLDTKSFVTGRMVCDVKVSAMELIRARSYDLASLANQVLGMKEDVLPSYSGAEIRSFFDSSEGIRHFIGWTMEQCLLNIKLVHQLQVLPLAMQITAIAGNTLSRTLMGGRSERNEFLLLHAFHTKGYIVPDKYQWSGKKIKREGEDGQQDDGKKGGKSSYVGGLVLDPKKGFYDNFIVLMDFNSLYPSIIQEFNVCFTTSFSDEFTDDSQKGVLPEEIRKLVDSRKLVKNLMQQDNLSQQLKTQYDIRQKALKLTANSMYGCLGFRNSRFYAKELAAYITGKGREILLRTKETVEKMGYDVIYGDTDSIMINSNSQETQKVYQIGHKIKAEINKQYKLLELEIDGIFRFMLLLKKKKYAALVYTPKANGVVETSLELKGLDMVRRDWAPVAGNTAKLILDEIMSEQPLDDKIYKSVKILNDVAAQLRSDKIPLKDLMITKQLAKNPEEYKDPQGLYHVQVALRMNASGKLPKKFKNGDTVSYIFCNDGLAHHSIEVGTPFVKKEIKSEANSNETSSASSGEVGTEVKSETETLQPDPLYYLSQQIHPVVSRICEPIPGLDAAHIAECLGMDPTSFKRRRMVEESHDDKYLGEETEAEKYRECEKFSFKCANMECRKEIVLDSPFVGTGCDITLTLFKCPGCSRSPAEYFSHLSNTLTLFIRRVVSNYYKNVFVCEDPSCTNTDRKIPIKLYKGFSPCRCRQALMYKEYRDDQLQKQLNYLYYIFDVPTQMEKLNTTEKEILNQLLKVEKAQTVMKAYMQLTEVVHKTLKRSAYSEINLSKLFADVMPQRGIA